VIIGTAGHIDHGKSSLVEALTGVRMDRLREERERGITIELNFAPFALGEGQVAGVVDVPGHEDFVRTMVAGASGIDLVLLVIAADEGIKPQTREHLAIAEQLGIQRGIPVITKADLVEPEWILVLEEEIADWLKGSPVAFEPPMAVSAISGQGVDDLAGRIRRAAGSLQGRLPNDLFRLPVDRSFSVAGIGTVVTGTVWSGSISPGDQVLVLPSRKTARVRTVQVHGKDAGNGEAGMRVALGLAGVAREDIQRGDSVVAAGSPWEATQAVDVLISLLPDAPRALTSRSRLRLHLGTSEIIARVFPRNARIEPGSSGLARLALESPGVARGGDRFVIRGFSPVVTMGGGRVLDPLPPRKKVTWPDSLRSDDPGSRVHALVERRSSGVPARLFPVLLGVGPKVAENLLRTLNGLVATEDYWVGKEAVESLAVSALQKVHQFHLAKPAERGVPLAELRQSLRTTSWIASAVLGQLERDGKLVVQDGIVRTSSFTPRVKGGSDQVNRLVSHIRKAGLMPPSTAELSQEMGTADLAASLRLAVTDGELEPVERDRHYSRPALEQLVETLLDLGKTGIITPGQVRDRLGISRKYLSPLLEWTDARGITVRSGEGRRLGPGKLPWGIRAT
jgi:selenocysteine-specific elongation factor